MCFRGAEAWFGMEMWGVHAGLTFLGLKPCGVSFAGGNQQKPGNHLLSCSAWRVHSRIPGPSESGQMEFLLWERTSLSGAQDRLWERKGVCCPEGRGERGEWNPGLQVLIGLVRCLQLQRWAQKQLQKTGEEPEV